MVNLDKVLEDSGIVLVEFLKGWGQRINIQH